MDHRKAWRALAATHANTLCAEFIADIEARAGTEAEREQRACQQRERTKLDRASAKFPRWAPLEVCELYLSLAARPALTSSHPLDRYHQHRLDSLRLLLIAHSMERVWSDILAKGISPLSFGISTADYAATFRDGVKGWNNQTRSEKTKRSLEIAKAARNLAELLHDTPADFTSLFGFIPERQADIVAAHCMKNPAGPVLSVPLNAGHAIEAALPVACTVRTALGTLAAAADKWATAPPPYGKANDTQGARAFVKHLARYLRDECGDPLPTVTAECCHILMGKYFEPGQLRTILSESI